VFHDVNEVLHRVLFRYSAFSLSRSGVEKKPDAFVFSILSLRCPIGNTSFLGRWVSGVLDSPLSNRILTKGTRGLGVSSIFYKTIYII